MIIMSFAQPTDQQIATNIQFHVSHKNNEPVFIALCSSLHLTYYIFSS